MFADNFSSKTLGMKLVLYISLFVTIGYPLSVQGGEPRGKDFNGDGVITVEDLDVMGTGGVYRGEEVDNDNERFDLNGNGLLDQDDIDIQLADTLGNIPGQQIPPPDSEPGVQRGDFNATRKRTGDPDKVGIEPIPPKGFCIPSSDFAIWLEHAFAPAPPDKKWTSGDGNFDGVVNVLDLKDLLPNLDAPFECPVEENPGACSTLPSGDEIFGDVDNNEVRDAADLELICSAVGTICQHGPIDILDPRDLDQNGCIDSDDVFAFRLFFGALNLDGNQEVLEGDANLDGYVDLIDQLIWIQNSFQSNTTWTTGDWNCDQITDGLDFIILNANLYENIFD